MWSFLANRYKHVDRFAGFEVMSEPRTPNTGGVVSRFNSAHAMPCGELMQRTSVSLGRLSSTIARTLGQNILSEATLM